jgi:hypothetical protein
LYVFEDLEAVHSALHHLMRREPPLVKILPRQPGTKESRYMHLFSGSDAPASQAQPEQTEERPHFTLDSQGETRLARHETEIAELRAEVDALREQFAEFQKKLQ